jgi:hypothetical protein
MSEGPCADVQKVGDHLRVLQVWASLYSFAGSAGFFDAFEHEAGFYQRVQPLA